MLFGKYPLASRALAGGVKLTTVQKEDFEINGYGIQNNLICVSGFDDNLNVALSSFETPRVDGKGFISNFKRGRKIGLKMLVKNESPDSFVATLDELRKNIFTEEALLIRRVKSDLRQIKVNCVSSPNVFKHYNIDFLSFNVQFEALQSYWESYYDLNEFYENKTISGNEELDYEGTAKTLPKIILNFGTGLSGVNSVVIGIGDDEISISETISDSDVITIDAKTKIVTLNGTSIDYDGTFFNLTPGSNLINYTINGTFSVDLNVQYKNNYE